MSRVILAAAPMLVVMGCTDAPDMDACEQAVRAKWAQVTTVMGEGGTADQAPRPAECKNVKQEEFRRIVAKVVGTGPPAPATGRT